MITLKSLQDDKYTYVQEFEVQEFAELLGIPENDRKNVTGLVLIIQDGDILAAWVCDWNAPYLLTAYYYSLPEFSELSGENLPDYWQKDNPEYKQLG